MTPKRRHGLSLAWRALARWGFRTSVFYLAVVLIGLYPVNRNFQHSEEGVQIFVHPTGLHADIIVPIKSGIIDWRDYFRESDFPLYGNQWDHLSLGWGERRFFLETPQWSDLTLSNAAGALLWPSASAMRVQLRNETTLPVGCIRVVLNEQAYAELTSFLLDSFQMDQQKRWKHIAQSGYGGADTFYEGNGKYHLLNTCNTWTGGALKSAGLPVGWYLTWPGTTTLYLRGVETAE